MDIHDDLSVPLHRMPPHVARACGRELRHVPLDDLARYIARLSRRKSRQVLLATRNVIERPAWL